MSKYDPLFDYLKMKPHDVTLSFRQIADILGLDKLVDSAYEYPEWWSTNDATHPQSSAWTDAGFRADADLGSQIVTFIKER